LATQACIAYERVLPRLILSRDRGFSITAMEQGLRLAGTVEIGRSSHHLPPPEEAAYFERIAFLL